MCSLMSRYSGAAYRTKATGSAPGEQLDIGLHSRRSVQRRPPPVLSPGDGGLGGADSSGRRPWSSQARSQTAPTTPVAQNAPRQPQWAAIGITTSGLAKVPGAPPL